LAKLDIVIEDPVPIASTSVKAVRSVAPEEEKNNTTLWVIIVVVIFMLSCITCVVWYVYCIPKPKPEICEPDTQF
jgi:Pyruvate/2-oxoacid:ferredoxin oxidoreductase delta subunit